MRNFGKATTITLLCLCCSIGFAESPAFMTGEVTARSGQTRALADCTGIDAYQQPFDDVNFSTAVTADANAGYIGAEATLVGTVPTSLGAGTFQVMRFWGIEGFYDGSAWGSCTDAGAGFSVTYYTLNGTDPGTLVNTEVAVAAQVDTGFLFAGAYPIYEFTIPLTHVADGTEVYIGLSRQDNADSCWFLWLNESDLTPLYDDYRVQSPDGGATWTNDVYDLTMCLAFEPVPVELQSFTAN